MNRILLISGSKTGLDSLTGLLKSYGYTDVCTAASSAEARRSLLGRTYETVIINAPLADEAGDVLAVDIANNYFAEVIMVVKAETAELIAARVEDSGVIVISKPLQKRELFRVLRMAKAASVRIAALHSENLKLHRKLEEALLIGKVKCLLIERRQMTEESAHKYIERRAMDSRSTKREAAMDIMHEIEYLS